MPFIAKPLPHGRGSDQSRYADQSRYSDQSRDRKGAVALYYETVFAKTCT